MAAKKAAPESAIERWEDLISFATIKLSGVACMAAGVTEVLDPTLLHIAYGPDVLLPIGLGFLTGKKALGLARTILNSV